MKLGATAFVTVRAFQHLWTKVFAFDVWSAPCIKSPFGVSFPVVAHKAGDW